MFSGLIADLGRVSGIDQSEAGARLRIETALAGGLTGGDSVAVNGVCLTVTDLDAGGFAADAMNQTLRLTALGELTEGDAVNLEPALRASDRLGGHIVQGHVDGVGRIASADPDGIARRLGVELPAELRHLVVEHGSVAIDGVSLTVAELRDDGIVVSLIPETLARTTLGEARIGESVNIEVDVIARYVERLLARGHGKEG